MTARGVVDMIVKGQKFTSEEIDRIMIKLGLTEDEVEEYRNVKGYDDDRMLGLLRFMC